MNINPLTWIRFSSTLYEHTKLRGTEKLPLTPGSKKVKRCNGERKAEEFPPHTHTHSFSNSLDHQLFSSSVSPKGEEKRKKSERIL